MAYQSAYQLSSSLKYFSLSSPPSLRLLLIVKHTNEMPKQAHQECFSVNINLIDMQRDRIGDAYEMNVYRCMWH